MNEADYKYYLPVLAQSIESSQFWKDMEMNIDVFEQENLIQIDVKCGMFDQIVNEPLSYNTLEKLELDYWIWSEEKEEVNEGVKEEVKDPESIIEVNDEDMLVSLSSDYNESIMEELKSEGNDIGYCRDNYSHNYSTNYSHNTVLPHIDLDDIIHTFNYSFSSLILNLEFKFPFVFSFYGRHLFKLNYKWIKHNISETQSNQEEINKALYNNILGLETLMLQEYNTINIMKERTFHPSTVRKFKLNPVYGKTSIKNYVHTLCLIDLMKAKESEKTLLLPTER